MAHQIVVEATDILGIHYDSVTSSVITYEQSRQDVVSSFALNNLNCKYKFSLWLVFVL